LDSDLAYRHTSFTKRAPQWCSEPMPPTPSQVEPLSGLTTFARVRQLAVFQVIRLRLRPCVDGGVDSSSQPWDEQRIEMVSVVVGVLVALDAVDADVRVLLVGEFSSVEDPEDLVAFAFVGGPVHDQQAAERERRAELFPEFAIQRGGRRFAGHQVAAGK